MKITVKRIREKTTGWICRIKKSLPGFERPAGNVLLYIVLVMVIFGMLGATMLSLFTTFTVSTATLNEDRRARYLFESAGRYAMSLLRNSDFDSAEIDALNTTTYTLDPAGTFEFDIYSLWFRSAETKKMPDMGSFLQLDLDEGEIPQDVVDQIPSGNIFVVNIESTETDGSGNPLIPASGNYSTAFLNGFFKDSATSYRVALTKTADNTFTTNTTERICFAVNPTVDQNTTSGGSLLVHKDAHAIFPPRNGAVFIKTDLIYYDEAVHHEGSHVELTNLSKAVSVAATDYVILWPTNHTIIPAADTANVTYGGKAEYALNVVDTGDLKLDKFGRPAPDISMPDVAGNFAEKETESSFVTPDTTAGQERIEIGGGSADRFGGGWYDDDKSVGGVDDFCSAGRCQLGQGIRVFYTFEKTGNGRGYIFALVNGLENSVNSIGGDIQASELLGYAGDSRVVSPVSSPLDPTEFLDNAGEGLQPPKIGLEFDAVVNYSASFEQT